MSKIIKVQTPKLSKVKLSNFSYLKCPINLEIHGLTHST
jgi:hypothetical protein